MAKARKVTKSSTTAVSPFTLEGCKILQPKIVEAVKAALAPFGVTVGRNKYTYGEKAQIVLMFQGISADGGETTDAERIAFKKFHSAYGLKASDLDSTFTWGGKSYTVVGLNVKKRGGRREPKVVKLVNALGGVAYCTVEMARMAIDSQKASGKTKAKDEARGAKKVRKTKIRRNADNTDPKPTRKAKAKTKVPAKKGKAGRRISSF